MKLCLSQLPIYILHDDYVYPGGIKSDKLFNVIQVSATTSLSSIFIGNFPGNFAQLLPQFKSITTAIKLILFTFFLRNQFAGMLRGTKTGRNERTEKQKQVL
jgi:hypothetical protein